MSAIDQTMSACLAAVAGAITGGLLAILFLILVGK